VILSVNVHYQQHSVEPRFQLNCTDGMPSQFCRFLIHSVRLDEAFVVLENQHRHIKRDAVFFLV
jgi:hypothetical protein